MLGRDIQFRERISREREALSLVNNAFDAGEALNALSPPAIERWRLSAAASGESTVIHDVSVLLKELSRRLKIRADNSKEVFSEPSCWTQLPTEILIREIGQACRSFMAEHQRHAVVREKDDRS